MSAAPDAAGRPSARVTPKDILAVAVLAAALAGLALAPSLYDAGRSSLFFPRQPAEFLPPSRLEQEKAGARADLAKDPEDLKALTRLTMTAYQEGAPALLDCIENGDRALSLGALDDRLFYFTGACYEAKGLFDYAAQNFEKFLRHHPDDLEVRLRLGNLYYRMDDPFQEKAAESYRKVLVQRPGDALVSFNLAVLLRDRQLWQEGLDVLTPILARDKTLPAGGFRVLGDLYYGLKDLDRSLEAYREEIKRSPDDADLLAAAAQVHDDAGRTADALATWNRVLDLNPRNKQALAKVRTLTRRLRQETGRR